MSCLGAVARRAYPGSRPRTLVQLDDAVSTWVHWYGTQRLMHRLGLIPPLEYDAATTRPPAAACLVRAHRLGSVIGTGRDD